MTETTIKLQGKHNSYCLSIPVYDNFVITSRFCPEELLPGGDEGMKGVNTRSRETFTRCCNNQIIAMDAADRHETPLDIHIAGLMATVMDHLARFHRIMFNDLLMYIDCFALLLEADGFESQEIRRIYPQITKSITDLYPEFVFDNYLTAPFTASPLNTTLSVLSQRSI